jgi:adenylate cyclase
VSEQGEFTELWRGVLTGGSRGLERSRRIFSHLPSDPRCKLCRAPYGPPGGVLLRAIGGGPSPLNRRLCKWCLGHAHKHPGGAEVEISILLVDVRGSTGLAEKIAPEEFSRLIARFYATATRVIDRHEGIVDKFVGDEVVALFVPGFAGERHAERAVEAARELLEETGNRDGGPWIPIGAGVHTGVAYVGRVGEGDACDFTAVGDAVNTTARLASSAGAGEVLVSKAAADASMLDATDLESRTLTLRGRDEMIETFVLAAS